MALTLITRENFENVGIIDAASPGAFSSVSGGTFYKRPVGPRITATPAPGWSADVRSAASLQGIMLLTGTGLPARDRGIAGMWVRFKAFPSAMGVPLVVWSATGARAASIRVSSTGAVTTSFYRPNGTAPTGPTLALNTWYYLAIRWQWTSGNIVTFDCYALTAGAAFTPFGSLTTLDQFNKLQDVRFGVDSANDTYKGRIGACGLYSLDVLSDADWPSGIISPVESRNTWTIDPVNGSDSNDGLTAPWLTVAKFNEESLHSGLIDVSNGYENGDIVVLDTRAGSLTPGTSNFQINTRGLTLKKHDLAEWAEIAAHVTLSPGGWTKTGGYNHIYQTADTAVGAVLWEDDKWMSRMLGANFAAVAASLDSTAGSFWTDGTTLYAHAFGNTNPASDGKVYTRSVNRGTTGKSMVQLLAPDQDVYGLRIRKTALVSSSSSSSPYEAYGIIGMPGFGGTSRIRNCYVDYASTHCIGFVDSAANSTVLVEDCQAEQCFPYETSSTFVSFNGNAAASGNSHTYRRCTTLKGCGVIGSTAGTLCEAFISHNGGSGTQYSLIRLEDCEFPSGKLSFGSASAVVQIVGGRNGGFRTSSPTNTVDRCLIEYQSLLTAAGTTTTVRDCIFTPTRNLDTGFVRTVAGTVDIQGCTVDTSAVATGTAATSGIFQRSAALNFTWRNNVFKNAAGKSFTILENAVNTDTISFDHNAYQFGSGTAVMKSYNDGSTTADRTFAQWQALGKDADSFTTSDPKLDASYYPLGGSPLIGTGTDRGMAADYSGKTVNRISIGALEALASLASKMAVALGIRL